MTGEALLIAVIMLGLGIISVALPFLRDKTRRLSLEAQQLERSRDALITSYERVLSTIRDLDDDFRANKINHEDYDAERHYWADYGVRLLQLLENDPTQPEDSPEEAAPAADFSRDTALNIAVEDAIRSYREALQSASKQQ